MLANMFLEGDDMNKYAIPRFTTASEIKMARNKMGLTQAQFADLLGISKPTVERMEASDKEIKGPIVLALFLLLSDDKVIDQLIIPPKKTKLRLSYMYKNELCTIIDVDELNEEVLIKNYKKNVMFKAFGSNDEPTFTDYQEFLKSRCFPETRDKMKLVLKDLNIPFYDPLLIIEKTKGRMAEDDFWLEVER